MTAKVNSGPKVKGTASLRLDSHDLINLTRDSVIASCATLFVYLADVYFPGHPEQVKFAVFVLGFAALKTLWKLFTDTRIIIQPKTQENPDA